jgi:hypothetical protein
MGRCHSTGAGYLPFMDGATMKSVMVGKKSSQSMLDIVVTAGNIDQSYVIYKLMDQHLGTGVAGRGRADAQGRQQACERGPVQVHRVGEGRCEVVPSRTVTAQDVNSSRSSIVPSALFPKRYLQ